MIDSLEYFKYDEIRGKLISIMLDEYVLIGDMLYLTNVFVFEKMIFYSDMPLDGYIDEEYLFYNEMDKLKFILKYIEDKEFVVNYLERECYYIISRSGDDFTTIVMNLNREFRWIRIITNQDDDYNLVLEKYNMSLLNRTI